MANKTQSLTVTQILNASAKDKEYNLYDGDSLSLRIKPIGTNTKSIKFMISCFKVKIYAHKATGMILKSKSDHFINAFGIIAGAMCYWLWSK
ncbi:MAG: hypothetical protein ACI8UC_001941 [Psychromonas sp.]|jgi:hypothetical protein